MTIVDTWLEPLPGAACGENLEYDDEFREMEKAAAGKPAGQFDPEGVPPDWRAVLGHTQSLFERTRDLRVAAYWTRAQVRLDGVATLPEGLRLMEGLLARHWDELHPLPDDGDAYARVNALNELSNLAGLLGDVRDSLVLNDRSVGELRGRDVEVALGVLEPRSGDVAFSRSSVEQMLRDAVESKPELREFPAQALSKVAELQQLMRDRVGYAAAPEFQPLITTLTGLRDVMPGAAGEAAGESADGTGSEVEGDAPRRGGGRSLTGSIESRNDALRAIDMVCEYLERTEPTNPAQLLLRRARKLVNKNFVELVRELAPESLNEVARVMGISAEELSLIQGQE
ncbi:MAG: type VI secretion system protein TssA [Burkholderiales bacterium]|nr:type VI secretion system protein TssA [Burkholderiales bacterium]